MTKNKKEKLSKEYIVVLLVDSNKKNFGSSVDINDFVDKDGNLNESAIRNELFDLCSAAVDSMVKDPQCFKKEHRMYLENVNQDEKIDC